MFCPKCAAQNLEGAKFCRACGADIRLVPHALAGTLVPAPDASDTEVAEAPPTLDVAVQNIFKGIAFLLIVVAGVIYLRTFWVTIWFIIPALSNIGRGIGQALRAQREPRPIAGARTTTALHETDARAFSAAVPSELAPPDTNELDAPPASVTEGTTRHLDAVTRAASKEF